MDRRARKILSAGKPGHSFPRASGRCGNEGAADSSTETKRIDTPKCEKHEMGVLTLLEAVAQIFHHDRRAGHSAKELELSTEGCHRCGQGAAGQGHGTGETKASSLASRAARS